MDPLKLFDTLKELTTIPEIKEFPELQSYLDTILSEDVVTEEPYEIANEILLRDKEKALPKMVRSAVILLFHEAFRDGNADAMNDLGAQYYGGSRGFEQDFTKAVEYYTIAAQNGCRQAQENLGYCYYYGRNMPVNYEKAFHFFALGAFDGHLISLYKIGDMYAGGHYVQKNEKEAFLIYERCLDEMTEEAEKFVAGPVFLRLGRCYLNGFGVKPDPEKALVCYQKAELYLYDMVKDGDVMYKKSLNAAIDGQAKAREQLTKQLPTDEWGRD